jgi:hypothetical protein
MDHIAIKKGTQNNIVHIFIRDSAALTGNGKTGITYNAAGLACKYLYCGGTLSGAITIEDIAQLGVYQAPTNSAHIRFKELNSASPSQGVYELHLHNDWLNPEMDGYLVVMLAGATNMTQLRLQIEIESALTGIHTVALQVYETASVVPIADVFVDIWNSTETTRMNGLTTKTDALGQLSFQRDDGTYKIRLMKAGVTFAVGTVVVNGADVSSTLYGTPVAAAIPPAAGAIRVYENCFMPDGSTPMTAAAIVAKAKITSLPYDHNGRYHSGQEIAGTYNASTGQVYWDLPAGAQVEFYIKHIHKTPVTRTVPDVSPARLAEVV